MTVGGRAPPWLLNQMWVALFTQMCGGRTLEDNDLATLKFFTILFFKK